MKYCEPTTLAHPISIAYPSTLKNINDIIVREGYTGTLPAFPNNETVIDMDEAERIIALSAVRLVANSMDMAFGISNATKTIRKILLVEFKLRVGPSLSSVSYLECNEKIVGSRNNIGNNPEIYGNYIFVFQSSIKEYAKYIFFRWNPRLDGINKAMDMAELRSTFFS